MPHHSGRGQATPDAGRRRNDQGPAGVFGTAGTARLDVDADTYRQRLIAAGMEHHTSLVYGEHRPLLRKVAGLLGLDVIELT